MCGKVEDMVIKNLKLKVSNAKVIEYEREDKTKGSYTVARFASEEFDNPFQASCSKAVKDGIYNCALKLERDFDKKKDKIYFYVGEPL